MEKINYIGEHLWPGQLGHLFAILAFIASLVSTISYFISVRSKDELNKDSWRKLGRYAFFVQVTSVIVVFSLVYYIIANHLFEYKYAWQHSSRDLEPQYLFACFWEGQEGSFLLWSLWQSILGTVVIFSSKKWEAPVMAVIAFSQVMMGSMLLGIHIDIPFLEYRLGSNPFLLMRQDQPDLPIFHNPNYLSFKQFTDGNGLNELLRNYWMVIHPPVLFCGFASVLIPFAYGVAGLWTRNYTEWIKPALPWALFSAMMLGTGIMMGAAWAYESLTFGGYWAWDPVENASLVPWLTLVAGIHTLLAYRSTGHSLRITIFFFIISYTLILYSSFLTKSGVLGQTSVHSFTDMGMSGQLLISMMVFAIPAFILMFMRRKELPRINKEESGYSREFWLFMGALVLMVSAVQITFSTSIPVWNKLLEATGLKKLFGLSDFATPGDVTFHYNQVQIWLASIIAGLTAVVQYMKYKDTPRKVLFSKLAWPTLIALLATVLIGWLGKINYDKYGAGFLAAIYLLLFASLYSIVANFGYIFTGVKGKLKNAGASIAHVGFGLSLLGILISSSKKEVLSIDRMGMLDGYFTKESGQNDRENVMLPKDMPVQMGPYFVTYKGDSVGTADKDKTFFIMHYEKKAKAEDVPTESFTLYPDAYMNVRGQEGITPNPDSKHYLTKDIFTYITGAPRKDLPDTLPYSKYTIKQGDTIFYSKGYLVLNGMNPKPTNKNYQPEEGDVAVGADITVHHRDHGDSKLEPVYFIRDRNFVSNVPDTATAASLAIRFSQIIPAENKVEIEIRETSTPMDYVVLKALVFPFINVLWVGLIVMFGGFLLSMRQRMARK